MGFLTVNVTDRYVPVPKFYQENTQTCWVTAAQSLACYHDCCVNQNRLYEIAKNLEHGACTKYKCNLPDHAFTVQKLLNKVLNIKWEVFDCKRNLAKTDVLMRKLFSKDVPYILNYHHTEGQVGHSVAVCGGKTKSTLQHNIPELEQLIVMNPDKGDYERFDYTYLLSKSTHIIFTPTKLRIYPMQNGMYRSHLPR